MEKLAGGAGCSSSRSDISKSKFEDRQWFKRLQCLTPEEFKSDFKISRSTFNFLCDEMRHHWSSELVYSVEERIAVMIWRLANGKTGSEVMEKFGLPDKNVSTRLFNMGCCDIAGKLKSIYLKFPDKETVARREINQGFEDISGIPDIIGAIYTTRLKIKADRTDERYVNYRLGQRSEKDEKDVHSLPVQGVVDCKGIFIDLFCNKRATGGMTDDEVLEESDLCKNASELVHRERIVGGHSFPLKDWLLVPYPLPLKSRAERLFNEKSTEVQEIARRAFGQLIGRWSFLGKQIKCERQYMPEIVCTSFILHNICEERGDSGEEFLQCIWNDVTLLSNDEQTPSAIATRKQLADDLFKWSKR